MEDKLKELFASGEAKVIADGVAKQQANDRIARIRESMNSQLDAYIKKVVPEELWQYLTKGSEALDYSAKWYHWYLDVPDCTQIQIGIWAGFSKPVADGMPEVWCDEHLDIRYITYQLYSNSDNVTQSQSERYTLTDFDKVLYKAQQEYAHLAVITERAKSRRKEAEIQAEERQAIYSEQEKRRQAEEAAQLEAQRKEIEERNKLSDVYITTDEYGVTLVYFSERFWKSLKGGDHTG